MAFSWTDERVETLKRLFVIEGMSASLIGARMGVSRNAAIGKLHRMGIARAYRHKPPAVRKPVNARQWTIADSRKGAAARTANAIQARALRSSADFIEREAFRALPDLAVPESDRLTLEDRPDDNCKWPFGDGPFYFHRCKAAPGAPYCEFHAKRAFNPVTYKGTDIRKVGNRGPSIFNGDGRKTGISTKELAEFDEMARG